VSAGDIRSAPTRRFLVRNDPFNAIAIVITVLIGALALITAGAIDFNMIGAGAEAHNIIAATTLAAVGVRAQRVIRLFELPQFLGLKRSQINELIKDGRLHPFSITPGGRAKVVTEHEVIELQKAAIEAVAATPAPVKEIAPNRKRRLTREARPTVGEGT
jgi:predicted DNA-binding transcriptional regulator AlpA